MNEIEIECLNVDNGSANFKSQNKNNQLKANEIIFMISSVKFNEKLTRAF